MWFRVKQTIADYFFFIVSLIACTLLLFNVGQIGYAFSLREFYNVQPFSLLVLGVILLFYLLSFAAVIIGGRLYEKDWFRQTPHDGAPTGHLPRWFAWTSFLVRWPTILARKVNVRPRKQLGATIAIVGVAELAVYWFTKSLSIGWPLWQLGLLNTGIPLILLGIWLWFVKTDAWKKPGRAPSPGQVLGWRIAWLVAAYVLGELIWGVATLQLRPALGYVMYSQWAICQLLFTILMVAHTIDYWDRNTPLPVRVGFTALLLLMGLFRIGAEEVATSPAKTVATLTPATLEEQPWYQQLEKRVDSVPGGPCVLVAASGGGSRAALFASLMLRGMHFMNSYVPEGVDVQEAPYFSDHIVIVSSVSGGSLATAECFLEPARSFQAQDDLATESSASDAAPLPSDIDGQVPFQRNASHRALTTLIEDTLEKELSSLQEFKERQTRDTGLSPGEVDSLAARIGTLDQLLGSLRRSGFTQPDPWVLNDPVIDRMGTDFMAAFLRGVLTLGVSRGESLRRFWDDYFGWRGVTNTSGPWNELSPPGPLLLFNACDSGRGSRFILGIPPLPSRLFVNAPRVKTRMQRQKVRSVADTVPLHDVALSHIVRLSSNFPWGFRVRKFRDRNLVDGGVIDNTGIDSLYEIVRRLSAEPSGKKLLAKMAKKGVFIVEIDSGGKPSVNDESVSQAAWLFEPLRALGWAQHNNSEVVKEFHLREIERMIQSALDDELQPVVSQHLTDGGDNDFEIELEIPKVVTHIRFQCENLDRSMRNPKKYKAVMTAWALNNQQKARVTARFWARLALFRNELQAHRADLLADLERIWAIEQLKATDEALVAIGDLQDSLAVLEAKEEVKLVEIASQVGRAEQTIADATQSLSKNMWFGKELRMETDLAILKVPDRFGTTDVAGAELSEKISEEISRRREDSATVAQNLQRQRQEFKEILRANLAKKTRRSGQKTLAESWEDQATLSDVIQSTIATLPE